MDHRRFADRVALVTGGSRGIGRACCVRLANEGARVALNYHQDRVAAEETRRLIEESGGEALVVQGDVSQGPDVDRMNGQIEDQLGGVDLLVNNSGVFDYAPHRELTEEVWRRTIDINLTGVYLVTWRVKEGMLARRYGRIVNMSSISALRSRL